MTQQQQATKTIFTHSYEIDEFGNLPFLVNEETFEEEHRQAAAEAGMDVTCYTLDYAFEPVEDAFDCSGDTVDIPYGSDGIYTGKPSDTNTFRVVRRNGHVVGITPA